MLVGALRVTTNHGNAACMSCAYQCFNPIASFEEKTAVAQVCLCMHASIHITYK